MVRVWHEWYENSTSVARMVRMKEESVKDEVTTKKKKIELFLGNYCSKLAQKVLYHDDAKMMRKNVSLIGAKSAKKVPNEKLVLAKNRRELRLNYVLFLSQNGAKMAQILAQKILTSNESIMSRNMSQKGESSL